MSILHARSGQIVDVRPIGGALRDNIAQRTLVRANHLEIFRLVMVAGKATPLHRAAGAITIQCLEGTIELEAHGRKQRLSGGDLVYLADAEPHAVVAIEDASLLITVMLRRT